MNFRLIDNIQTFHSVLETKRAALFYFAGNSCNVAEALMPKVASLIDNKFPNISLFFINMESNPDITSEIQVYIEPTILVYFDGKEFIRKSRNTGIIELEEAINRPYKLIYS